MGMQYSICRIPSSVPQGGVECAFDPSPTQSSIREPWGASHGSQLPLETHSFIMHDLTLWVPNAIDHQTICRRWFGFFSDIFPCLCGRLKSGWSSMVALQKKKKKISVCFLKQWALSLYPNFFYAYAPPCHYSLFWGDRRASRKAIYFKLQIRWIAESKDKMIFLSKKRWVLLLHFVEEI